MKFYNESPYNTQMHPPRGSVVLLFDIDQQSADPVRYLVTQ